MPEWKQEISERLAVLKLEPAREAEIVEELSQHLEDHYAGSLAGGATPEEAYRAALAELSDSELLARELRRIERPAPRELIVPGATGRSKMIGDLWQDLRYGARMLRKNPAFTVVVVITLSLGIGANTAIFSVVNTALLQPLPIKDGARIVELHLQSQQHALADFSYPDFTGLRDRAGDSIDLFANHMAVSVTLGAGPVMTATTDDGEEERVGVMPVSGNYFATLGATTTLGRTLTAADDQTPGAHPVIGYTSGLSIGAAIAFGLTPAWQATRFNLVQALKQEGGLFGERLARSRFQSALVVAQVAVSLVLLVGAGLFVRALHRAMSLHPGFDVKNNWVIEFDLRRRGYDLTRAAQFNRDIEERIEAIPSVKAVVWVGDPPLGDRRSFTDIGVAGHKPAPGEPRVHSQYNTVSLNYFSALSVPVVRGRAFSDEDVNAGSPVVVISESLARAYWPNENPLGKRLWVPDEGVAEIVGVAKDSLLHAGYAPYFYRPVRPGNQLGLRLLVKTRTDSPAIGAALKESAQALDPKLKVSVKKHEADIEDKFGPIQLGATLSSLFGVLALALAAMGLYGVMAYAVEQRTHEIGVRMALGARAADVLRLVLRQGMALAAIGVLAGLVGSAAATRVLKAALYGISPTDPGAFIAITLLLGAVALVACYIPARRATKVDPMVSLRCE